MSFPLLTRLAEICRESPLREKVVVVPSLAVGHQIGDALARSGTSWVNLRFETTRTIADAIAGFELARDGWTVLSRAQALAILERACDRVLGDDSYFSELRGRPGLYRAIQRSIDDLRHAGLRELPPDAFEDERKARDLTRVLAAYEEELHERRYVDRFGVLARAIQMIEKQAAETSSDGDAGARFRGAIWFVADDVEASATESRLISLVAGRATGAVAGATPPDSRPARVSFVRAAGEENEIRHALRHAAPFDSAEIIYTTREPYLALAYELTAEHAIPATFAEGISAAYTRPGQAALGFLRWIGDDFDAAHLQKIARAGAIDLHSETLSPAAFARVLRHAMIGWGRARYVPRLEAFVAKADSAIEDTDSETVAAGLRREAERGREALRVVRSLIAFTEGVGDGDEVDAGALAQSALDFLNAFAETKNEIDGMALAALRRMLLELTRLPDARAPRSIVIERLRGAVAEVHVGASNPRPGHLHVTPVRAGGWSGRTSLFVVGLDDAKYPGSGLQDPIVLDAERATLNSSIQPRALDLRGDAPARASARLRSLFARVPEADWTLSWAELDLRERRPRFPSRDVLEIYREVQHPGAKFEDLIAAAVPAGFVENELPLNVSEWVLADRRVRARESAPPPFVVARESDAITEYDGRVSVVRDEIDPRLTGREYSASQIERMARCPFGWFLERVLKIEPIEELERVQDRWLDARQFGTLVHEVLQTTMELVCESGEKVSLDRHLARVHEIAQAALDRWRAEVPPGTETAYARQRGELLETCAIFLRAEERLCDRIEPRFFELGFGGDDAPFSLPLRKGKEVRLRGRIDRVDRDVTTGGWEVWDYKTGSLYEYNDAWKLRRGTKVQHAIYARALEHVLRMRNLRGSVQCSGYYFPTAKGAGARVARNCGPGELENALDALFDVVGSGFFPQPDEGRCDFCPYPEVCGDPEEVRERMARKQAANANDPAVKAWRRLQEVE